MSPQPVWGRGPGSGRHATGATPLNAAGAGGVGSAVSRAELRAF